MRLPVLIAVALSATPLGQSHAQQFFVPGSESNGQINVQVNATLDDGIGDFHPVSNLVLMLYRGATDSLQLRTDEAGILRYAIAPGTYRLSTPAPVQWHGRNYRWNVPLEVQRRMGVVNLTVTNATVAGPPSSDAVVATQGRRLPIVASAIRRRTVPSAYCSGSCSPVEGSSTPGTTRRVRFCL